MWEYSNNSEMYPFLNLEENVRKQKILTFPLLCYNLHHSILTPLLCWTQHTIKMEIFVVLNFHCWQVWRNYSLQKLSTANKECWKFLILITWLEAIWHYCITYPVDMKASNTAVLHKGSRWWLYPSILLCMTRGKVWHSVCIVLY